MCAACLLNSKGYNNNVHAKVKGSKCAIAFGVAAESGRKLSVTESRERGNFCFINLICWKSRINAFTFASSYYLAYDPKKPLGQDERCFVGS